MSERLTFERRAGPGQAAADHDDALSGCAAGEPLTLPEPRRGRGDRGQEVATADHRAA